MSKHDDFVPAVTVTRSGFVENIHTAAAVALDSNGAVVFSLGNPDAEIFGRSSNKPLQADAMLGLGATPTVEQLALGCASHSGDATHVTVVRSTLDSAGLPEEALQNTATLPFDRELADAVVASGGSASPILQNCSGKHAMMLMACVANDWPTDSYLEIDHPLQQRLTERVAELAGGVVAVGIDGCGAPTHATTLSGLARAFATLAASKGPVWSAMTNHPELVGGAKRAVTQMMRDAPGLMAKDGADGVFAAAMPDGRAAAVKVGGGASHVAGAVLVATLQHLGILAGADPNDYADPVTGHGRVVGRVDLTDTWGEA